MAILDDDVNEVQNVNEQEIKMDSYIKKIILIANEEKDTVVILSLEKYNQLIKDIENAKYLAKLDLAYEQMMINKKMDEEIEKKKNLNRNKGFGIGD